MTCPLLKPDLHTYVLKMIGMKINPFKYEREKAHVGSNFKIPTKLVIKS